MSDSLRPHESQHTRPPCPSPAPRAYPNPCPSSWWCHPAISSSVIPFSSCPQSLPASGSFPTSQLFTWGGQPLSLGYNRMKVLISQSCLTLCNPMDCAHQAPLSLELSRQEYCSGLPFPSPGEPSQPRDRTHVACIAGGFFTPALPEKPVINVT